MSGGRPLAVLVLVLGTVLLALGCWVILRASFRSEPPPRAGGPARRPAGRPAPPGQRPPAQRRPAGAPAAGTPARRPDDPLPPLTPPPMSPPHRREALRVVRPEGEATRRLPVLGEPPGSAPPRSEPPRSAPPRPTPPPAPPRRPGGATRADLYTPRPAQPAPAPDAGDVAASEGLSVAGRTPDRDASERDATASRDGLATQAHVAAQPDDAEPASASSAPTAEQQADDAPHQERPAAPTEQEPAPGATVEPERAPRSEPTAAAPGPAGTAEPESAATPPEPEPAAAAPGPAGAAEPESAGPGREPADAAPADTAVGGGDTGAGAAVEGQSTAGVGDVEERAGGVPEGEQAGRDREVLSGSTLASALPAGSAVWGSGLVPGVVAEGDGQRRTEPEPVEVAPRSTFAASMAARAAEDEAAQPPKSGRPDGAPRGDVVTPMGTVLGGASTPVRPPGVLPPPSTPSPAAPETTPRPDPAPASPTPTPWTSPAPGPTSTSTTQHTLAPPERTAPAGTAPEADPGTPPEARGSLMDDWARERPGSGAAATVHPPPTGPPAPPPRHPAPAQPAGRRGRPRRRRGRPEDPRQGAVYDALTINERVLDEVWTNPSVDVLKVVSSIVVNALDAYEDDPAEYSDWVAGHQSGQCDCH